MSQRIWPIVVRAQAELCSLYMVFIMLSTCWPRSKTDTGNPCQGKSLSFYKDTQGSYDRTSPIISAARAIKYFKITGMKNIPNTIDNRCCKPCHTTQIVAHNIAEMKRSYSLSNIVCSIARNVAQFFL